MRGYDLLAKIRHQLITLPMDFKTQYYTETPYAEL